MERDRVPRKTLALSPPDGFLQLPCGAEIRSLELALSPPDAEPFLTWLFGTVARHPERLRLLETARVARYLAKLASERGQPAERRLLDHFARVLWGTLLQSGKMRTARKAEVLQFLKRHAATYLAGMPCEQAIETVRKLDPPTPEDPRFRPPELLGRHRMVSGGPAPGRLADDLTERIWVAYHVLEGAGVKWRPSTIAEALNRQGLQTRARGQTSTRWGSYEVSERIRQFDDSLARQVPPEDRDFWLDLKRNSLSQYWVSAFLAARGEVPH